MKARLADHLICPTCGASVRLAAVEAEADGEVLAGRLACAGKHVYPIRDGVPRMLPGAVDETQLEVKTSYDYKWGKIPEYGFDRESRDWNQDWYLQRYRWGSREALETFLGGKRFILDAGCGLGRDVAFYSQATTADVVGVDISRGVDFAFTQVGRRPNVHLLQADLTRLPFQAGTFDFIASDQVLHHTPSTRDSLAALVDRLQPGGDIAIYVYRRKSPVREFTDDYIRAFTTQLPDEECWRFAEALTALGKALAESGVEIELPNDIPHLGIRKGRQSLHMLIYWHFLKCFYIPRLSYEINVSANFDWAHPKYAWRHSPEEVHGWFQALGLEVITFDVCEPGISVRGRMPRAGEGA